jgi:phenylalanyl-tRNA synthetase beta chain
MRLSVNSLGDWLSPLPSADEVARTLTSVGFEVEGREDSVDGVVLEINVTPNRGDALSVRGLARELGAALECKFTEPAPPALPPAKGNSSLPITLADPRCPRYLGVEIHGAKNGPSPAAVQKRLAAFGMRPISIFVDAANWVMLELGQPLHSFDLDTLKSGLTVRPAKPGEKLVTLDGQTRDLTPWPVKGNSFAPMMICDGEAGTRVVAFAGVMGGFDTEISDKTVNIYLEAATFDPLAVRRAARKYALLSEASHRFERGVDPALPALAAARFAQLLREWGAGGEISGWRMADSVHPEIRMIELRDAVVTRLLGIAVPRAFIEKRLAALGLVCRDCQPELCRWEIPSWRPDLTIEEDLIEEIGRHYGYDRVPETLPSGIDPAPGRTGLQLRIETLRQRAFALGFSETVSIPFTDKQEKSRFVETENLIRLANPIWLNHPELQVDLVYTLLPAVFHNLQPDVLEGRTAEVRLFEIGTTFATLGGRTTERTAMALAFTIPEKKDRTALDYLMHDLIRQLFGNGDLSGVVIRHFPQDPGRGIPIGVIYVPDVNRLEFPAVTVRSLPRFPAIIRDLNLLMPESMHYQTIRDAAIAVMPPPPSGILEQVSNLDRGFHGNGLPEGHFALAVRFTFRKPDGTLTTEEAEAGLEKIKAALAKIGVTVRGAA